MTYEMYCVAAVGVLLNWLLPWFFTWTYIQLLKASGDIERSDVLYSGLSSIYVWELVSKESWYAKLWSDWLGVGLFKHIIVRPTQDALVNDTVLIHEECHCRKQWMKYGSLFVVMYVGHFLWILLTQKIKGTPYTRHPYYDNWAERQARQEAHQLVDIPPDKWRQGPYDLNPWLFNPSTETVVRDIENWRTKND